MVEILVRSVSKQAVKPSSPTPDYLRRYDLSFLDQVSPPVYNPLVLFYAKPEDDRFRENGVCDRLKSSLSDTLSHFYVLAGRSKGNEWVECNNEGVPWIEATIDLRLCQVMDDPIPKELNKLLPFALDAVDDILLGVQLNRFTCGGVALGLCMSHKVADGLSVFTFVRFWMSVSRGEPTLAFPDFVSAERFPPRSLQGYEPGVGITTSNIVSKLFVFRADKIEKLKAKYSSNSLATRPPSRVEALSTFLWSRYTSATGVCSNPQGKTCFILQAVNLRTKFDPPLPEHSFGNYYRFTITFLTPEPAVTDWDGSNLVLKVRETLNKIDQNYIEELRKGDNHLDFIKRSADAFHKGELISLNFTSLCKFPVYDSDFGWGRPTWVASAALTYKNLVVFIDTKSGDGIEAYINLKEDDMAKLEADEEFQLFTSPTPVERTGTTSV
ncbi:hypothetical protein MLD38_009390 [Melastoma candidum]|uniref:Uncharacterized protein n=1 Tax=Melastoma candidum TaxID=119954 RepID=A0ACB9RYQ3_9MYRT|nr:hypothetical protein MLD38_009390 [Melastoma candidum]